ncbi:hypothetical protein M407DRAFT_244337, partial [Tulasnella calospora MUT 4182]
MEACCLYDSVEPMNATMVIADLRGCRRAVKKEFGVRPPEGSRFRALGSSSSTSQSSYGARRLTHFHLRLEP